MVDESHCHRRTEARSPGDKQGIAAYARELEALKEDEGWRSWLKSWMTTALAPVEQRRARRMVSSPGPLRLHLGCADNYLTGWVNVDLARPGRKLDLRWNLRRPLPFPAGSVEAIFAEHLLEHLAVGQGLHVLQDCQRLLHRSGVLRIGVPDLSRYVRSYQGADSLLDEVRPARPTPGLAFCEVFFRHGHRSMYDFPTLQALCREAGFTEVHRSKFGTGHIQPCPDTSSRRRETLYIEAMP